MEPKQDHKLFNTASLLIAAIAGVAAFLPFSANTSAWNAVTLRVPGDQGNWWHLIAGAPFFLAFPMVWLAVRAILSLAPSIGEQRAFWSMAAISVSGTLLVEMPVILRMGNLAQMGFRRQLTLVAPGLCILILCAAILVFRYKMISPTRTILLALSAAYLTNATFCLEMYAPYSPQSGWYVTMAIVWLIALQIFWILFESHRATPHLPSQ